MNISIFYWDKDEFMQMCAAENRQAMLVMYREKITSITSILSIQLIT